jgi:hypothetical protein
MCGILLGTVRKTDAMSCIQVLKQFHAMNNKERAALRTIMEV